MNHPFFSNHSFRPKRNFSPPKKNATQRFRASLNTTLAALLRNIFFLSKIRLHLAAIFTLEGTCDVLHLGRDEKMTDDGPEGPKAFRKNGGEVSPTTMGFLPLKMIILGCEMGGNPPFKERPISGYWHVMCKLCKHLAIIGKIDTRWFQSIRKRFLRLDHFPR